MTKTIIPVVLAGGSGTRLWPLSRKNYPKQFLKLQGEFSLLQQTMMRVESLKVEQAIIISNEAHYFLCQEQLEPFALKKTYLLEPCPRNTAPAIALAAHYIAANISHEAIMLILPSDHWFGDDEAWVAAMLEGIRVAETSQHLVTFGIKPNSPNTGYGYIEADSECIEGIAKVKHFHEKPNLQTAETFLQEGRYYWNSGLFVTSVATCLKELATHAPDIAESSLVSLNKSHQQHDFIRISPEHFSQCRSESIDYAVMEKTHHSVVIPLNLEWSDLGCWNSVALAQNADENGNAIQGNVLAKDSHDCLISSENTLVTTLGIRDQIIVATKDAVLVADKRYAQQVKDVVASFNEEHRQLANDHLKVSRPWGYYEVLAEGKTFKVKRLMVKPGAKLSLQMHHHRAEHWVVVSGTADIFNDGQRLQLHENQSTYIPQKAKHRLANSSKEPLFVIEVQSGDYLGEDDIIRYEDVYDRDIETVAS